MKVRNWYRWKLFCHTAVLLMHFILSALLSFGLSLFCVHFFKFDLNQTLSLFTLGWLIYNLIVLYQFGNLDTIWEHITKNNNQTNAHPSILEDLYLENGSFKNKELKNIALEDLSKRAPPYPFIQQFGALINTAPIYFIILICMTCISFIKPVQQINSHGLIQISPPDYLGLSNHQLDSKQQFAYVFPGSLLTYESHTNHEIKDSNDNTYLPILTEDNLYHYEIRLLNATKIYFKGKRADLKISMIKDHHPNVIWKSTPVITSWNPINLAYCANDDFGLDETFITINKEEIEYAGSSKDRLDYEYKWQFNPLDFINLEGGNVQLQISTYDKDSVTGPKITTTNALIWKYAGVEKSNEELLKSVQKLRNDLKKRFSKVSQKPQQKDHKITKQMDELDKGLSMNPVIPPEMASLAKNMKSNYKNIWKENPAPSKTTQEQEKNEIQKDLLYLDQIEAALKSILNTVKISKLITKMNDMADKLNSDETIDTDEFEELYNETSDLLNKMDVPPQMAKQVLENLEQASLASMLGEKEKASELLNQSAEMMQSLDQQQASSSPMAKKFNEILNRLVQVYRAQEKNTQYLRNLSAQKDQKSSLAKIATNQKDIKDLGKEFAEEFRSIFEPLLNSPFLFMYADRAANHADIAFNELSKNTNSAHGQMTAATQNWKNLLQMLYRMQQQQKQKMAGKKKLKIGKNGKLQFSEQGMVPKDGEEDNKITKNNENDLKIALPEEFQKERNVEKFLKKELKMIKGSKSRDLFQHYIYDLLE